MWRRGCHTKFRVRKTSTGTWTRWSAAVDSNGFSPGCSVSKFNELGLVNDLPNYSRGLDHTRDEPPEYRLTPHLVYKSPLACRVYLGN